MKSQVLCIFLLLNFFVVNADLFANQNSFIQNTYQTFPKTSQLVNRAFDLASQGDFEIAIDRLQEAWSLNPSQTETFLKSLSIIHNNYAKTLVEQGEIKEAERNFRKAIFFDSKNLTASRNLDLLLEEQKIDPDNFQERLVFARKLREYKRLEEAIAEYREILKSKNLNQQRKQILMELGQVYYVYSLTLFEGLFFEKQIKNLAEILEKLKKFPESFKDPRFYLLEGFFFKQKKNLASSIESFQKAIDLDSDHKQAGSELIKTWKIIIELYPKETKNWEGLRQAMSEVYRRRDQSKYFTAAGYKLLGWSGLEKSLDFFEDALAINPTDQDALEGLIKAWKEIVKKSPDHPNNWIGFSQSLAKKGLYQEAKLASQKAKELSERNTISYQLSPELQEEVSRLLAQDQSLDLAKKAYQEQKNKNWGKAIVLYEEALEKMIPSPETAKIFYNLFLCYKKEKKQVKAWKALKKAHDYNPSSEKIQKSYRNTKELIFSILSKAKSKLSQGDYYQAEILYKEALRFQKNNPEIYFNLGLIAQELKRYELSENYYQEALKLSPKNQDYFKALNSVQVYVDEHSNGISYFPNSKEKDFETLVKLGLKYQSEEKNFSLAIQKYQEALKINPNSAVASFNLATIFHSLAQKEKAIDFYKKAYQCDQSNYPETNFFIGFLLESLGKFKDSTFYYSLYLQDKPNGIYAKETKKRVDLIQKLLN